MRHKLDKMASTPHDGLLGYQQKKTTLAKEAEKGTYWVVHGIKQRAGG